MQATGPYFQATAMMAWWQCSDRQFHYQAHLPNCRLAQSNQRLVWRAFAYCLRAPELSAVECSMPNPPLRACRSPLLVRKPD